MEQRLYKQGITVLTEQPAGLRQQEALEDDIGAGAGAAAWGGITGSLPDQTDLQAALNGKQPTGSYLTSITGGMVTTALGFTPQPAGPYLTSVTKADVGLGNVDNTNDLAKPISTATQTALDAKQASGSYLTAVSIATANGISGSSSGGLTPALTLTLGAITPSSVVSPGAVMSSGVAAGIGYTTGAGGSVTQITSKATPVTLNAMCGRIVMHGAALAANTSVAFRVNNSNVVGTDTINVNLRSGAASALSYLYCVVEVTAGSFVIAVRNMTAGSLSETLNLTFAIIKAV